MKKIIMVLTVILSGRAMTLAFIHRAGGHGPGDPPIAWLMPLIGDAVIGITGVFILFLIFRGRNTAAWITIICWNVVAIWDALSAFIISVTNPWPEFFMYKLMGPSMFFAASAMHLTVIYLVTRPHIKSQFVSMSSK